jgi:hypothetical protein
MVTTRVTVDELLTRVNIALGKVPTDQCPAFEINGDGIITIAELLDNREGRR